jgi:hypothetical protein
VRKVQEDPEEVMHSRKATHSPDGTILATTGPNAGKPYCGGNAKYCQNKTSQAVNALSELSYHLHPSKTGRKSGPLFCLFLADEGGSFQAFSNIQEGEAKDMLQKVATYLACQVKMKQCHGEIASGLRTAGVTSGIKLSDPRHGGRPTAPVKPAPPSKEGRAKITKVYNYLLQNESLNVDWMHKVKDISAKEVRDVRARQSLCQT